MPPNEYPCKTQGLLYMLYRKKKFSVAYKYILGRLPRRSTSRLYNITTYRPRNYCVRSHQRNEWCISLDRTHFNDQIAYLIHKFCTGRSLRNAPFARRNKQPMGCDAQLTASCVSKITHKPIKLHV